MTTAQDDASEMAEAYRKTIVWIYENGLENKRPEWVLKAISDAFEPVRQARRAAKKDHECAVELFGDDTCVTCGEFVPPGVPQRDTPKSFTLPSIDATFKNHEERLKKLEEWAHEPYDFTDLIRRVETLEKDLKELL